MDRSHALLDSCAAGGHEADEWDALVARRAGRYGQVLAVGRAEGSAILASDLHGQHPPAAQIPDAEGNRAPRAAPERQAALTDEVPSVSGLVIC